MTSLLHCFFFFFFNDTATTEIYTLSLHDALPICLCPSRRGLHAGLQSREPDLFLLADQLALHGLTGLDRKSTRLNSSHVRISYAVFCLKKKKTQHCQTYVNTVQLHDSQCCRMIRV